MWRRVDKKPKRATTDSIEPQLRKLLEENARLFNELEGVQQKFRGLARGAWRVQEDERRRLARELHDQLGQSLTALVHRLEQLRGDESAECIDMARQSLEDVRELSRLLRPPVLDDLGLVAALQWLARRTRESSGLTVNVSATALPDRLEDELETLLFRVAQEALNNAVKHAGARRVDLSLARAGNRLELRIRDDGRGFDIDQVRNRMERGVGLIGMQERVALFGGDMIISSAEGRGTSIAATLDLASTENVAAP